MIDVRKITKVFNRDKKNEVTAVRGASFHIANGEIFGLLGPNGAGKTTTLRIIATILKPDSGDILVDNKSAVDAPEQIRKAIGFLTGETKLYDYLTVRETFDFFGRLYNIDGAELNNRIDDLVATLNLSEVQNKRISRLSDGMKQRVSLGRTIIHNPLNLILDEPLTGLDIIARRIASQFIKSAKSEGKCIVFSTHVMSEAEELCDRIAFIHNGMIMDADSKENLKRKYNLPTLEDIFMHLTEAQK